MDLKGLLRSFTPAGPGAGVMQEGLPGLTGVGRGPSLRQAAAPPDSQRGPGARPHHENHFGFQQMLPRALQTGESGGGAV